MASRPEAGRTSGRAHARFRQRRKEVARDRGRRRLGWVAVLLVLAAVVAGALWLRSSQVFAVDRVILPVSERVSEKQLLSAVGDLEGVTLLRVDVGMIERRLAAIPYVRTAGVYRRFPDALEVRITEYEPFAVIQGRDGQRWLVSDDGRVLERAAATPEGLTLMVPAGDIWPDPGGVLPPAVVGALPLARVVRDPEAWPQEHPVGRVTVDEAGEVVVVLKSGVELRMGTATNLEQKLMVADEIIDQYLKSGAAPAYVDVHDPELAVAMPKEP